MQTAPAQGAQESWAEGRLVLPGGVLDGAGTGHKQVWVRELTGRDEELLADRRYRNGARQVTDLLSRVLLRVEGMDGTPGPDVVSGMLIGDRDYLLLRLRQMSLGDDVHQVMRCPAPGCGEKVDVEFSIGEIPVRRVDAVRARYPVALSARAFPDDEGSDRAVVRLPTGADHEAVAELGETNPGAANTLLLSRVVLELGAAAGLDADAARDLPLRARTELVRALSELSPGPDLEVAVQCPHCGADMSYTWDLRSFFLTSGR